MMCLVEAALLKGGSFTEQQIAKMQLGPSQKFVEADSELLVALAHADVTSAASMSSMLPP